MKRNTIKLSTLLGENITSRSSLQILCNILKSNDVIDMSDIVFISRSVADELCNFEESYNIMFVGMSDFTRKMLSLVRKNRNKPRKRQKQDSKFVVCDDIETLLSVVSSI